MIRFYACATYHEEDWSADQMVLWLVGTQAEATFKATQRWGLTPHPELSNRKFYASKEVDLALEADPLQAVFEVLHPVMAAHPVEWMDDHVPESGYVDEARTNTFPTLEALIESLGG
jgi:hypothetical protein